MFSAFASQLYPRLLKIGFAPIRRMYDNEELSDETKYTGLSRNRGPVSHVVFLVNLDEMGVDTFIKNSSDYISNLRLRASLLNFRNLLVAFILVTKDPNAEAAALTKLTDKHVESSALRLYWHVVLSEKTVENFETSEKFLDIDKLLQESLDNMNGALFVPRTYLDMYAESQKKNSLPPLDYKETVVFLILFVNIILCAAMDFYPAKQSLTDLQSSAAAELNINILSAYGALIPQKVMAEHEYYRLLTSNFLHTGTVHLIITSLCVYIFGSLTERYLGAARFLFIYLFAGIFGNLVSLLSPNLIVFAGATASVFGLAGALLALTHKTKKEAKGFSLDLLFIFLILGFYLGFADYHMNNFAHLGGFAFGYFMGYVLYPTKYSPDPLQSVHKF